MGIVYRATDNRLGRDVALKFPHDDILHSQRMTEAFEREARAAAALNHPNICTVYGVGEHEGRPFIAMELLEGETVESVLASREMSMEEVVAIALQVAAAMQAAHARHIIHRDIKPANIFVTAGNIVKVMDFGIAKCPTGASLQTAGPAGQGQAAAALYHRGDSTVHGAGTVARPCGGCAVGHILLWRGVVRDDRPAEAIRSGRSRKSGRSD